MSGGRLPVGHEEHDLFVIARYVGLPGHQLDKFLRVAEMCGYELRGPKGSAPSADAQDAGAVTAEADPHQ